MASEPLPGADSAASEAERVAALVEQLAREAADNKDKLLRSLAEMENMRRRTERQVADARDYGITAFARDVLAVADNMNRALSAIDPQFARDSGCGPQVSARGRRADRARAAQGAGEARRQEVRADR